jgi:hypothetical protein
LLDQENLDDSAALDFSPKTTNSKANIINNNSNRSDKFNIKILKNYVNYCIEKKPTLKRRSIEMLAKLKKVGTFEVKQGGMITIYNSYNNTSRCICDKN